MKSNIASGFILAVTALASGSAWADKEDWDITKLDVGKLPAAAKSDGVTYAKDIRPLFEASCFNCHGEKKQKGELRLDSLEAVLKGGESGKSVVPTDSSKSSLVFAIARNDDKIVMPPKPRAGGPGKPAGPDSSVPGKEPANGPQRRGGGPPAKPLTAEQVGLVRAWIDQGAK